MYVCEYMCVNSRQTFVLVFLLVTVVLVLVVIVAMDFIVAGIFVVVSVSIVAIGLLFLVATVRSASVHIVYRTSNVNCSE